MTGKLFAIIFGALAQFGHNVIIERAYAGLEAAQALGKKGGRKPALNPEQYKLAPKLISEGRTAGRRVAKFTEIRHTFCIVLKGQYDA